VYHGDLTKTPREGENLTKSNDTRLTADLSKKLAWALRSPRGKEIGKLNVIMV